MTKGKIKGYNGRLVLLSCLQELKTISLNFELFRVRLNLAGVVYKEGKLMETKYDRAGNTEAFENRLISLTVLVSVDASGFLAVSEEQ